MVSNNPTLFISTLPFLSRQPLYWKFSEPHPFDDFQIFLNPPFLKHVVHTVDHFNPSCWSFFNVLCIFVNEISGPAAALCAETLRQEGFKGQLILATKEKDLPYDRTKLSKVSELIFTRETSLHLDFHFNLCYSLIHSKWQKAEFVRVLFFRAWK